MAIFTGKSLIKVLFTKVCVGFRKSNKACCNTLVREPFTNTVLGGKGRNVYQNLEYLVEGCNQPIENYQEEILGKKFPGLTLFPPFHLLLVFTTG